MSSSPEDIPPRDEDRTIGRAELESGASGVTRSLSDPEEIRAFAARAARCLSDDKCEDIVVLDVRELSQITEYIVIGSGTSQRQMGSALDDVEELAESVGIGLFRKSADRDSLWLLADFVDVVVHLFEPNTRAHYDLEMLWGDAPRVEWLSLAPPGTGSPQRPAAGRPPAESPDESA